MVVLGGWGEFLMSEVPLYSRFGKEEDETRGVSGRAGSASHEKKASFTGVPRS
jgi:hypothetical protein